MSATDRERWDARHAAVGAGTPMPPDGLRGRLGLLPGGSGPADRSGLSAGGRALDVACGRGAVAVWLAHQGFAVDAVDVSGAGLASARALAAAEGVRRVRFLEADLDAGLPVAGPYDLVVCQRYRDPALYPALAAALAPGGLLVLTVLSEVGDEGGRFRAVPGELVRAFPQLETVDHREGDGEATLLARRT
ncbi:class I SAM-dependent methyltransferase [Pseudonocardia halophobica]|uniref:SAM-dependent methyltransferase n=1 Tax=Pseudonocardia halophobica TaxID=29401 RepID=A0A9W6L572_9PSEU|nr:methyltransferase domain-containing protein [Pseudonocardia halophobica]GLL13252.1 SAM-dependent methyltransferase [Pseudonocardia halophobica]